MAQVPGGRFSELRETKRGEERGQRGRETHTHTRVYATWRGGGRRDSTRRNDILLHG